MAGKGVPQGGVLSPLLYIIYVKDITKNVPKSVKISQFADDIAVYIKFNSIKRCKSIMGKSIQIIKKNLSDLGLDLSPQKTKLIHFNNKNIHPGEVELLIDNVPVRSTESVRFLGIILDYKFLVKQHVNYILKRCLGAINIIKYLRGT